MKNIIHYFCDAISCLGYVEYYCSNLATCSKILILERMPEELATKIFRKFLNYLNNTTTDASLTQNTCVNIEVIHSSIDSENIIGLIIDNQIAIIDNGIYKHINSKQSINNWPAMNPSNNMCKYIHINVGVPAPTPHDVMLTNSLESEMINEIENSIKELTRAKSVHDCWESIYINEMNFEKADTYISSSIKRIFDEIDVINSDKININPDQIDYEGLNKDSNTVCTIYDRFLGAGTYCGPIDYINGLSEKCKKYFILGYPGTSKSTLLRRLAAKAEKQNMGPIELYHCGFDPNSLDMVIINNHRIAVFDCTAPHSHTPKDTDSCFNVYENATHTDVNKLYREEINEIRRQYVRSTNISRKNLEKARTKRIQIDQILYSETLRDKNLSTQLVDSYQNYLKDAVCRNKT